MTTGGETSERGADHADTEAAARDPEVASDGSDARAGQEHDPGAGAETADDTAGETVTAPVTPAGPPAHAPTGQTPAAAAGVGGSQPPAAPAAPAGTHAPVQSSQAPPPPVRPPMPVRPAGPPQMSAQFWPVVNQILGLIQQDEHLQELTSKFELTRNAAQDQGQFKALDERLRGRLPQLPNIRMLNGNDIQMLMLAVYDELIGISVLGRYWRDNDVDEILVDAWDSVTIEKHGQLVRTTTRFRDPEHARTVARLLAAKVSDRALTQKTPIVDAELPGARVAFAIDKVVKTGIAIAIRKARPLMGMNELMEVGAFDSEVRDFLADCVAARANIVVSGGTSSGKTTVINALSSFIPATERVITIEDTYELALANAHRVNFQTKAAASADDTVSVTMADLLATTLRMRPDRVIVGEIRDGKAAVAMLDAANTGHDGTMTTIHANTADRAVNFRLTQLLRRGSDMSDEVAKDVVASAIDLVVQVVRRRGKRFISEVAVVESTVGANGQVPLQPIFEGQVQDTGGGSYRTVFRRVGSVGADTDLAMKLIDHGRDGRWVTDEEA